MIRLKIHFSSFFFNLMLIKKKLFVDHSCIFTFLFFLFSEGGLILLLFCRWRGKGHARPALYISCITFHELLSSSAADIIGKYAWHKVLIGLVFNSQYCMLFFNLELTHMQTGRPRCRSGIGLCFSYSDRIRITTNPNPSCPVGIGLDIFSFISIFSFYMLQANKPT